MPMIHEASIAIGAEVYRFADPQIFENLLRPHLASLDKLFADSAIPSSVASCNQICHTAAFEECGKFRTAIEGIDKLDHLH